MGVTSSDQTIQFATGSPTAKSDMSFLTVGEPAFDVSGERLFIRKQDTGTPSDDIVEPSFDSLTFLDSDGDSDRHELTEDSTTGDLHHRHAGSDSGLTFNQDGSLTASGITTDGGAGNNVFKGTDVDLRLQPSGGNARNFQIFANGSELFIKNFTDNQGNIHFRDSSNNRAITFELDTLNTNFEGNNAENVGTLRFTDAGGDGDTFSIKERGNGNLAVYRGSKQVFDVQGSASNNPNAFDIRNGPLGLDELSSNPSTFSNRAHVYAKNGTNGTEIFVQNEAGQNHQITPGGDVTFSSIDNTVLQSHIRNSSFFYGNSYLDSSSDFLWDSDTRFTTSSDTTFSYGSLSGLFDVESRGGFASADLPATVTVNWGSEVGDIQVTDIALFFQNQSFTPDTSVTIETYDDDNNDGTYQWNTRLSTSSPSSEEWAQLGNITKVRRVRFTVDSSSDVIVSQFMLRRQNVNGLYLQKDKDQTIYGNLTMENSGTFGLTMNANSGADAGIELNSSSGEFSLVRFSEAGTTRGQVAYNPNTTYNEFSSIDDQGNFYKRLQIAANTPLSGNQVRITADGHLDLIGDNVDRVGTLQFTDAQGDGNNWQLFEGSGNGDFLVRNGGSNYFSFKSNGDAELISGNLGIGEFAPSREIEIKRDGQSSDIALNRTSLNGADIPIGVISGQWEGTRIARINLKSGNDTTNKDEGIISFTTTNAGTEAEQVKIKPDGSTLIGAETAPNTQRALTVTDDIGAGVIRTERSGAPGVVEIFRNGSSSNLNNGGISFQSLDSNNIRENFARINGYAADNTDGSEKGQLGFQTLNNGSASERLRITGGSSTRTMEITGSGNFDFSSGNAINVGTLQFSDLDGDGNQWELTEDSGGNFHLTSSGSGQFEFEVVRDAGVISRGSSGNVDLRDGNVKPSGYAEFTELGSDPATGTNVAQVYAKNGTNGAEIFVQDESGNVTEISSHDTDGRYYVNHTDGINDRDSQIHVEQMAQFMDNVFGTNFLETDQRYELLEQENKEKQDKIDELEKRIEKLEEKVA